MIENFGIGIDISNVEKFKNKIFKENEKFYRKIFSEEEILYCLKFKNYYERFAGKFAIKEALIKSINEKIQFLEIETSHMNSKPIVKILNSNYRFLVSVSHDGGLAVAVVISEKIN
tara:strand:- start:2997 stop:3344 length:348 start_codon:yes stop_codon:yes gene_type:complete